CVRMFLSANDIEFALAPI
ncbi:hypothetical protein D043_3294B, partial [Vibrio parahaemolyticus EKP-021]